MDISFPDGFLWGAATYLRQPFPAADHETQVRTIKDSGRVVRYVAAANGL